MSLETPHRRFNLLTGEWVLVSPHRAQRPWLGQVEKAPPEDLPAYDPGCYLCPGNARAAGKCNPDYTGTYVFDNDFPALLPHQDTQQPGDTTPLLILQPEWGACRVVCFSPRHDLSLPELSLSDVEQVIHTWSDQTAELGNREDITCVQVFENKGAMMGASNPHPHSQIWATAHLPTELIKELSSQESYRLRHDSCLLCAYLAQEQASGERLIAANAHFTALVPFWAVWPFEVMLISHRHVPALPQLSQPEVVALADLLHQVTARYDNLFESSFPYSMGFHQMPFDGEGHAEWHLHAHFYPPLLRSAVVRKFMVGFELLAMPQRDLTPEAAAARLRSLGAAHYKSR